MAVLPAPPGPSMVMTMRESWARFESGSGGLGSWFKGRADYKSGPCLARTLLRALEVDRSAGNRGADEQGSPEEANKDCGAIVDDFDRRVRLVLEEEHF